LKRQVLRQSSGFTVERFPGFAGIQDDRMTETVVEVGIEAINRIPVSPVCGFPVFRGYGVTG
jgi:hypothetical protein